MSTSGVDTVTAAARRLQRRLRAHVRYARMSVAMALAESTHHTSRGQRNARAGVWVRDLLHGEVPGRPTSQPELIQLFEEEPGGAKPPCLGEPRGPQEKVQQCTVEQLADVVPMVQILDTPGLLGGIRWWTVEQVIAVPLISLDQVPQRSAIRRPPRQNNWWKCRRSPDIHWRSMPCVPWGGWLQRHWRSRSWTIQFLKVGWEGAEVFKVYEQDWVQQRRTWSRSLTFLLVEVSKVFSQARVRHRVDFFKMRMRDFKGFFALFPSPKK